MFKSFLRSFLALFVWLYQRTDGKFGGKVQGLPVLLLTTTGRKTGRKRITPLGYFKHDGYYVITASFVAFGAKPGWFYNLKDNPVVTLQIQDEFLKATAEPVGSTLRQNLWDKLVEIAPNYRAYQQRTTSEIPMFLLRPLLEATH